MNGLERDPGPTLAADFTFYGILTVHDGDGGDNEDGGDGEALFLTTGVLSEYHAAHSKAALLALLARPNQARQASDLPRGLVAAAGDIDRVLARHDGDDMVSFAALLGKQVICGVLEHADLLASGDAIKAVVSRRADLLLVHSLVRSADHLMLLPPTVFAGQKAFFWYCMGEARNAVLFAWLASAIVSMFVIDFNAIAPGKLIVFGLLVLFAPVLVMCLVDLSTYRSTRHYGRQASAIFAAYGFPRPDDFDTRAGVTGFPGNTGGFSATNCALALEKHRQRFHIEEES